METTTTNQPKRIIYPGESLGGLIKFLGWFIFIISVLIGIGMGSNSNKSETDAILLVVIIASSIPTGLIFGALGCILENLVQMRKENEGK
jgi:hypothetical protein